MFKKIVEEVQELHPDVILDVAEVDNFSLWRSPRRGAITTATEEKVDVPAMELMGRWKEQKVQKSGSR